MSDEDYRGAMMSSFSPNGQFTIFMFMVLIAFGSLIPGLINWELVQLTWVIGNRVKVLPYPGAGRLKAVLIHSVVEG